MITEISKYLIGKIGRFAEEDSLIFDNRLIRINKDNFCAIPRMPDDPAAKNKTIAFIDGGQAEILSAGNFCLSFIRVAGLVFSENKKIKEEKKEFYLLTTAKYAGDDLVYESKIFSENNCGENYNGDLIDENDLLISSTDQSIKTGIERAPISKAANMARRFAELSLAAQFSADMSLSSSTFPSDFVVLDGTLEPAYKNEDKYLDKLNEITGSAGNVCALAKSSSLFTTSGNSPVVLLNKLGFSGCWDFFVDGKSYFVKLHEQAKHVFRFTGNQEVLPWLVENSKDALFLGYPYGLIAVDKLARISNEEKNTLRMNFLLRTENKEIVEYLNTSNAHEILDRLG